MIPESSATVFHISDLEVSVKYYTEVLGFGSSFHYHNLTGLKFANVFIHLSAPDEYVNSRAMGQGHVYIACDEIDQYFRDIAAKGALILVAPGNREYGMRDFAIEDPDGNILAFGKEIYNDN